MKRKKQDWVAFEDEVFERVKIEICRQKTMLNPKLVTVHRKKGYYSKDRQTEIIFEVAIEGFMPRGATPSLVWIWECKDYPDRKVKVDEIEEFFSKLMQIGIVKAKGTVVTRVGFASGAIKYAKSQGIGLVVLDKELVPVTHYQNASTVFEELRMSSPYSLLLSGREFKKEHGFDIQEILEMELRELGLLSYQ